MPLTNYLENKLMDHLFRSTPYAQLATLYFALIRASRGAWAPSTSYTSGDTVIPTTPNGRMYRCTTSGMSGGSEPVSWSTTPGGTTSDGAAVWTEMTPDFEAGTNLTEVTGGSYARVGVTRGDAQFKGTHGSTSGASSGTGGTVSNAADIQFASPTGTWGRIPAMGVYDALTTGNLLWYGFLTTPKQVNSGDSPPKFPTDGMALKLGR